MASLVRRVFRSAKRMIKRYKRDLRTYNLYEAARRLLADDDYERVSVARIAAEAGVSVGAFYERFPSKDNFLGRVIQWRLLGAVDKAERELDLGRWRRRNPETIVRAIVEHIITALHGAGAGVVRAALKRGSGRPEYMEPLAAYRAAVSKLAVDLLADHVRGLHDPIHAVQTVTQMVQATMLDTLLQDHGPLQAGRRKTLDSITRVMVLSLNMAESVAEDGYDDDAMIEMPIEDVVAIEVSEPAPKSVVSRRHRTAQMAAAKPIKSIRPKTIAKHQPARPEAAPRRKRVRLI